jgi:hypothetical protein
LVIRLLAVTWDVDSDAAVAIEVTFVGPRVEQVRWHVGFDPVSAAAQFDPLVSAAGFDPVASVGRFEQVQLVGPGRF